jgi:hypothetical protein
MFKKAVLILTALASLTIASAFADNANDTKNLTPEEQALLDKGATMEMYEPTKHSGHEIVHITAVKDGKNGKARSVKPDAVLCFTFGMEDAQPAREEGRSMAEFHYTRAMVEQFLFAEGWDKYHDRFFTRAYVQEGEQAYEKALRSR